MVMSKLFSPCTSVAVCLGLVMALAGCGLKQAEAPALPKQYTFWPPAPDAPRIQYLTSYNRSSDISPPQSDFEKSIFGSEQSRAYSINKPYGVHVWNGRIYVCDVRAKGITVLDLKQKQTRIMGATGAISIAKAVDLAIDEAGTKYVVDAGQSAILVYDADERYVKMYRLEDSAPVGIAIGGDVLYVTDFKNAHVKMLNRHTGALIQTIGERGGEDGQFIGILGVAIDKAGNLYVSDTIKARIQKFSPDGRLLHAFGAAGNRPGNFVRPKHLAIDSDGMLHVVDAAFNNVQVFDPEGRFVGVYGGPGTFAGAMDLPAGIAIAESDLELFEPHVHPAFAAQRVVIVANQFGESKIAVYAMGELRPGKTVADVSSGRIDAATTVVPATQPAATPATEMPNP